MSWAAQTGKHLLRIQNVSEQNQKHFFVSRTQNLCPKQMLRSRANGETFVSATMCPQQCVLFSKVQAAALNLRSLFKTHMKAHRSSCFRRG